MVTLSGDENIACDQTCKKALYYFIGNVHYYIFIIGFMVRFYRHRNIGKYNLKSPRPNTYVLKILLQCILALQTFTMIYDISPSDHTYENLGLVYIVYGLVWMLSIYLQFFEYKRGLPHAWYTHQSFWILAFISNLTLFLVLILDQEKLFDFGNLEFMTRGQKIKSIVCYMIAVLCSAALSYLGVRYKREFPQFLRNYLPPSDKNAPYNIQYADANEALLGNDVPRASYNLSASISRMPGIKATVQSYAVEQGTVNFKILIQKDNVTQKKLKKTYNDFLELDQIIETKYAKYIREGIMNKIELPKRDQYNFDIIQSLEQYKNQLKAYLDSLSNEPNTKINEEQKDDQTERTNANENHQNTLGCNYIPKELLIFYDIDLRLVDPIMLYQDSLLNQQALSQDMNESNLYGKDLDFIVKKTDDIKSDVRNFLLNVLKREELYKVKVDCIQKNMASSFDETQNLAQTETESVIFTFQINNCFVFNKTLREVEKFCKDMIADIKNPLIQPMNDLFSFCYLLEDGNHNNSRITSQNAEGQARVSGNLTGPQNTSGNDTSRRYRILYQELEQACQQLEGYFKLLLNDPDFYNDTIFKFFNSHQLFVLFPFVAIFKEQNRHLVQLQNSIVSKPRQHQVQQSEDTQQSNFSANHNVGSHMQMDEIIEEDEDESSSPFVFTQQKSSNPSQRITGPQRYANELKLVGKNLSIMGFIGLSVTCKVIKHQIQIFGTHPTNLFTIQVTKKFPKPSDRSQMVEEQWNIKLVISNVIQLANDLNIKYINRDRQLPQLLLSLMEYQNQVNSIYQNDSKLEELEDYLNQLLSKDTVLYSPALRSLFQFDNLINKKLLKQGRSSNTDPFKDKHTMNNMMGDAQHKNLAAMFGKSSSRRQIDEEIGIIETDGQLEDYFDADKEDPFRMNDKDDQTPKNNSFLVSGLITKNQKNQNQIFQDSDEDELDNMNNSTGMFARSPPQKKKESGMIGNFPLAKDYFKEIGEGDV
ncbi:UNKNOWN [Stylonychia lemnae]|uniref:PX domain-containing protein n=1 Tax=Stylonychia lemnae TaxID=5949 RepID=A0A077ZUF5_STYLE|nr:UNKNOWN [Stylonychia lemnae]|eukprot:CDW73194.1 UNKNOWN [Stylonychia lemnae]